MDIINPWIAKEKKRRKAKNTKSADNRKIKEQKIREFNKQLNSSESDILI